MPKSKKSLTDQQRSKIETALHQTETDDLITLMNLYNEEKTIKRLQFLMCTLHALLPIALGYIVASSVTNWHHINWYAILIICIGIFIEACAHNYLQKILQQDRRQTVSNIKNFLQQHQIFEQNDIDKSQRKE